MNDTQSILGTQLLSRMENLGSPARGRADVVTIRDVEVTNLNGKSLSKLIHWYTSQKYYNFEKHARISKI